jgi:regulator of cell morphogenesis and NO signaling
MSFGSEVLVAEIATLHPATIRVFEQYGIDFCCGGKRPLGAACAERNVNVDEVARDLEAAVQGPPPSTRRWDEAPLDELVDHVLVRYHRPLDGDLPRLTRMMEKVVSVHGARHPGLRLVLRTLAALVADLGPHMMKEEQVLFPYIRRMEEARRQGRSLLGGRFVASPIRVMEIEHEAVGGLLASLREETDGYAPPDDACNTYRGLFHGLAELEHDLHEHIHLENNVLFPRAARLEEDLVGGADPRE